jgi:preprotein translocase subunit SecA
VYQERAYELFMRMMDDVNYRVVRGLLGADEKTQVEPIQINLDELNTSENVPTESQHPLLRGKQEGIKIIRVK